VPRQLSIAFVLSIGKSLSRTELRRLAGNLLKTVFERKPTLNPIGISVKEIEISNKRWIRRINHPALFLTYDDGPNPAVTPPLLDLLQEVGGSATFFVTGESLDQVEAPSILRRMLAAGHTIGNHGQVHSKVAYPDFEVSQRRIENVCGVRTRIFRAPHGLKSHVANYLRTDRSVLGVHWTRHFEDLLPVDFANVEKQIPEIVEPGSILLLHDGSPSCEEYRDRSQVLALTEMIANECQRRSIPLAGLASVYPALHLKHSESKRVHRDERANLSSIMANSIATTISVIKHWCASL
jgi:peptidoglycan/xylan/chitin deacetylase (PgdA/CDA1 family)